MRAMTIMESGESSSFPDRKYESGADYALAYQEQISTAWKSLDFDAINQSIELLGSAIQDGKTVFSCGNGGSAAISNHLLCDFQKGIQTDTDLKPKVVSLSSNIEIITAVANDISYDDVFVYQLRTMAEPGDVLLTISSSGNSENIVRAIEWARENGVGTLALTGFDGGRSANAAEVDIHVSADNYGVIEDVHQSLMHIFAQHLRQSHMDAGLIAAKKF
jgi:D-sedoheptulose 7-phosphate isomerase